MYTSISNIDNIEALAFEKFDSHTRIQVRIDAYLNRVSYGKE